MFQVLTNLLDTLRPETLLVCSAGKDDLDLSLFFDRPRFYRDELEKRQAASFPPYDRFFLINVLKRHKSAGNQIIKTIEGLVTAEHLEREMLGPIETKGQYAWRIILKGDGERLSPLLASLYRLPGVHIEADPLYL